MDEQIKEVRQEIAETRARISDTLAALDDRVSGVKHAVTHTANPLPAAREHPWIALGLALAAGVALGMAGDERVIVAKAKAGARKVAGKAKEGAASAASGMKERFSGDDEPDAGEALAGGASAFAAHEAERSKTSKALDSIRDHIEARLEEVTQAMLDASREFTTRHLAGAAGTAAGTSGNPGAAGAPGPSTPRTDVSHN